MRCTHRGIHLQCQKEARNASFVAFGMGGATRCTSGHDPASGFWADAAPGSAHAGLNATSRTYGTARRVEFVNTRDGQKTCALHGPPLCLAFRITPDWLSSTMRPNVSKSPRFLAAAHAQCTELVPAASLIMPEVGLRVRSVANDSGLVRLCYG